MVPAPKDKEGNNGGVQACLGFAWFHLAPSRTCGLPARLQSRGARGSEPPQAEFFDDTNGWVPRKLCLPFMENFETLRRRKKQLNFQEAAKARPPSALYPFAPHSHAHPWSKPIARSARPAAVGGWLIGTTASALSLPQQGLRGVLTRGRSGRGRCSKRRPRGGPKSVGLRPPGLGPRAQLLQCWRLRPPSQPSRFSLARTERAQRGRRARQRSERLAAGHRKRRGRARAV